MSYDIILGRDSSDLKKFGKRGLINIGRGYVKMGSQSSLSNTIWLDAVRSHVILVSGKRGSGKSHSLGVIAEGLSSLPQENADNIASIIFDTMGIFWTMKYKNEKDSELLKDWGMESKNLPVKIFVPEGKYEEYKSRDMQIDSTFALSASELDSEDWINLFNLNITSPEGILLSKLIYSLKKRNEKFNLSNIREELKKENEFSKESKERVFALLNAASSWGIFASKTEGIEIRDLINAKATNIIDISTYSSIGEFNVRALIIGLISKKIFQTRMNERKKEELDSIRAGSDSLSSSGIRDSPLVWIFIDEAHEFLPKNETTLATPSLIQILREGRQPGISLVLATQQPGKIHTDVMSQSDIIISHKVTSKQDIEALNEIMQTYLLTTIKQTMDSLPSAKGSAIILDDNSERIYPMRIRPRFTWHGGESPASLKEEINL